MVFLAAVAALTLGAVPRCSLGVVYGPPTEEVTVVLARGTGLPVRVTIPDDRLYESLRETVREVTAYRFEVLEAKGGSLGPKPGETFLVVPWGYDAGCDPEVWAESGSEWVPVLAESVFRFSSSRPAPTGEFVIDVAGWMAPYPQGELLKYPGVVDPPSDISEWLSAREYYSLLLALPDERRFETGSAYFEAVRAALDHGDPAWSRTYPGTEVLLQARRRAQQGPAS